MILFTNNLQKTKYLGIDLTKEVKDLYNKNYKTLKKEIKDGKTAHAHGQTEVIL
jgi:hypothetical protein